MPLKKVDIRDAIADELEELGKDRSWLAEKVAARIECHPESVMRYLRRETRSSILEIPDACLTELRLVVISRDKVKKPRPKAKRPGYC